MPLNELFSHPKPDTGSEISFRSKERFKDLVEVLARDAAPCVTYDNLNGISLRSHDPGGPDQQNTAVRH
jgi:hypothetical protein